MRAIILAAGRGSRLATVNQADVPKSLLQFGQQTLLQRHLLLLRELGVVTAHVVVGYQAKKIYRHVADLATRPAVIWHENPHYEQGSVVSLLCAEEALLSGEPVLLMDADVLYAPQILERLVETSVANCFLLDRNFLPGDEPVKICLKQDRMIEFRKHIESTLDYDVIGESVGFFRFSAAAAKCLAEIVNGYQTNQRGDAPHEEALRDLLLSDPGAYGYEDITGLPWLEIDFPADLVRAEQKILPAIQQLGKSSDP